MRIDSSGNLYVGGTDAAYDGTKLITGSYSAGAAGLSILTSSSGAGYLLFGDGTGADGYSGQINYAHSTNRMGFNTNNVERLFIDSNGYIYSLPTYGLTTGASANMFVATDGSFQRSTSSLRYKNTVNDATHGLTELLTLRPVTYKGNNDGDTVFGGLIAEEVHDAGLTEFVQYNDEDEPDALAYGNMVSLCIKAIQEQQATIESQASAITDLTTRLTALENN
jgi:hypothetical protein